MDNSGCARESNNSDDDISKGFATPIQVYELLNGASEGDSQVDNERPETDDRPGHPFFFSRRILQHFSVARGENWHNSIADSRTNSTGRMRLQNTLRRPPYRQSNSRGALPRSGLSDGLAPFVQTPCFPRRPAKPAIPAPEKRAPRRNLFARVRRPERS